MKIPILNAMVFLSLRYYSSIDEQYSSLFLLIIYIVKLFGSVWPTYIPLDKMILFLSYVCCNIKWLLVITFSVHKSILPRNSIVCITICNKSKEKCIQNMNNILYLGIRQFGILWLREKLGNTIGQLHYSLFNLEVKFCP